MKKMYMALAALVLIAGIIVVAMPKAQAESVVVCPSYCYHNMMPECVEPNSAGQCPNGYICAYPSPDYPDGPDWRCGGMVA